VFPTVDPLRVFVAHQHWLTETGTYIAENVNTAELARGGHSEFLYMMSPIRAQGSTGSMIAPVAIV